MSSPGPDSHPTQRPGGAGGEAEQVWGAVSGALAEILPEHAYRLWIEPLRPVGLKGASLYLSGPDSVRNWTERRYADQLLQALQSLFPALDEIRFVERGARRAVDPAPEPTPLNPEYTFERFVIGPGNRLAHSAALHLAEAPGEAYNPLFLYGPPGLGKTHLMVAIAHYLREAHPEIKVHYTTAEAFTKEFVTALRHQGGNAFQERYRDYGALLIDDVQFLAGKAKTEEEFFHTFNALYEAGSQIVLSSDRPPEAHEFLAERLRDRFQWGLTAELGRPDLATRLAVVRNMAARLAGPAIAHDVLREIAERAPYNLRQLEGALTRVTAFASLIGREPDAALAAEVVGSDGDGDGLPPVPAAGEAPTIDQIQEAVCAALHLRREDLSSARRTPELVRGRHLAIFLCRELTTHSLAEIAAAFDRDHSTVVHAVGSIRSKLEPGSDLSTAVEKIRGLLNAGRNGHDET